MIGFVVVALAIVIAGVFVVDVIWRWLDGPHDLTLPELVTAGGVAGLGLWLALHWALAIQHELTRVTVAAVAIAFVLVATLAAVGTIRRHGNVQVAPATGITLLFLVPIFLWTIFILWRGLVVPPLSHDALAYHLPKAVLMMRAHGFEHFVAPDLRIGTLPANYEMLLADVLILTGSDALTEWIGTATFLLFLVAAAAVARRWMAGTAGAIATVLVTASAPVVLLHSGADKNDLLIAFLGLALLLFGARWCVHGGRTSAALAITAAILGVGTKPNAAAIAAGLMPFALWHIVRVLRERRLRAQDVVLTVAFVAGVFLLCGGWSYISNWTAAPSPGVSSARGQLVPAMAPMVYGDWFNWWQVPWLLLTIPFARTVNGVWAPWAQEYWFWPHYELYWSHYGFAFTIGVLVLPLVLWRYRSLPVDRRAERRIATAAGLLAVAIMLPVASRPIGLYGTYPRYMLAALPLLFAWTFAPLADELWQRRRALGLAFLGVLTAGFIYAAALCAERDSFAPLEFVVWASRNPGTRMIPFMNGRAGSVVDRRAGPHDTIAVEGTFETWVYPAYGAALSRPVVFLPREATPADIPAAADWVMIDRSWNTIWPDTMRDMGDGWKQLARGKASAPELRLFELLRQDPRFRLVYRNERFNQAVFKRVGG